MIEESFIKNQIEEKIAGTDFFIVDLSVDENNNIQVSLDSDTAITIDDCADVSRFVESRLNEQDENFSLQVGTAGVNNPLKLPRQYIKNIGRQLVVKTPDGEKFKGTLAQADNDTFTLTFNKKVKEDGKKKKKKVTEHRTFSYQEIKSAHVVVSFK